MGSVYEFPSPALFVSDRQLAAPPVEELGRRLFLEQRDMITRNHERRSSAIEIEIRVRQRTDGRPTGKSSVVRVTKSGHWLQPALRKRLAEAVGRAAEAELEGLLKGDL